MAITAAVEPPGLLPDRVRTGSTCVPVRGGASISGQTSYTHFAYSVGFDTYALRI